MRAEIGLREEIVDAAVDLATKRSWEAVRLYDVADRLSITLNEVRAHFREKEEIADAWFDRADRAMLAIAEKPWFRELPGRARLRLLMMTWLGALESHRKVTREMIFGKLEPGHLHVQIPGLLRISRTVQWMREAAERDATSVRRALEETALTTIYLAVFTRWMYDESAGSAETVRFLERALGVAAYVDGAVYPRRPSRAWTR